MQNRYRIPLVFAGGLALWTSLALVAPAPSQAQSPAVVKVPEAGVPETRTLHGKFVRAASNNEGYVILGYQPANRSIGSEWMLLEVGMTVLDKTPNYTLTRDAISLETPDGKTVPLATVNEQRAGGTQGLQQRADLQRDSIDYFPLGARQRCYFLFFSELGSPLMPFDEFEVAPVRGCFGRLYFRVPGGITYGQHWLNVRFAASVVRVPFTIMTPEEERYLQASLKDSQE
ncbi:MAG: hypothetical protein KBA72_09865 [Thermoanaerobaculia bacterium]|nr:hypothetical protein [Thermoanaerobaculia bacterium]